MSAVAFQLAHGADERRLPRSSCFRFRVRPTQAYKQMFDLLVARLPERQACRTMVEVLTIAHERCCESELADELAAHLRKHKLPDMAAIRARFAPDPAKMPNIVGQLASLDTDEAPIRLAPA